MMKKICIVEDDIGISSSLKLYLENSDFVVVTYDTWDKAVDFILEEGVDLLILDINLPVQDGVSVCKELRQSSNIPVIMLTARSSEIDKITGLEVWADDYIAKPFSPRELLARIQSILRRSSHPDEEIEQQTITYEDIDIHPETTEVFVWGKEVSLTWNEYDILLKICSEEGRLVSRETLMKDVIGYDNYVYDRTIDTHIKNLRRKLWKKDMLLTIRWKWYRLNI